MMIRTGTTLAAGTTGAAGAAETTDHLRRALLYLWCCAQISTEELGVALGPTPYGMAGFVGQDLPPQDLMAAGMRSGPFRQHWLRTNGLSPSMTLAEAWRVRYDSGAGGDAGVAARERMLVVEYVADGDSIHLRLGRANCLPSWTAGTLRIYWTTSQEIAAISLAEYSSSSLDEDLLVRIAARLLRVRESTVKARIDEMEAGLSASTSLGGTNAPDGEGQGNEKAALEPEPSIQDIDLAREILALLCKSPATRGIADCRDYWIKQLNRPRHEWDGGISVLWRLGLVIGTDERMIVCWPLVHDGKAAVSPGAWSSKTKEELVRTYRDYAPGPAILLNHGEEVELIREIFLGLDAVDITEAGPPTLSPAPSPPPVPTAASVLTPQIDRILTSLDILSRAALHIAASGADDELYQGDAVPPNSLGWPFSRDQWRDAFSELSTLRLLVPIEGSMLFSRRNRVLVRAVLAAREACGRAEWDGATVRRIARLWRFSVPPDSADDLVDQVERWAHIDWSRTPTDDRSDAVQAVRRIETIMRADVPRQMLG